MTETEYELQLRIEQSNELKNRVITLTAEGKKPSEISKLTGLTLREQREINEEFRRLARSSEYINTRSKEIIAYGDVHYNSIIERMNEVYEQAELNGDTKLQAEILGKMAAVESKRIEFLQKAGIINDKGIGEEVARVEARQEQLINILKEVKDKYPEASQYIRERLLEITGTVEVVRADQ